MRVARLIWFKLFKQVVRLARAFAALKVGSDKAARIPMTAIVTKSSTSVKPCCLFPFNVAIGIYDNYFLARRHIFLLKKNHISACQKWCQFSSGEYLPMVIIYSPDTGWKIRLQVCHAFGNFVVMVFGEEHDCREY